MKILFKINSLQIKAAFLALGLASSALLGQSVSGPKAGVANPVNSPAGVLTPGTNPTPVGVLVDGAGSRGALLRDPGSITVVRARDRNNVDRKYAYVTSLANNALEIVDVTDSADPKHLGSISHGWNGASLSEPTCVAVEGSYAYVTSRHGSSLEIIDVSDPTKPAHKSSLRHREDGASLNHPQSVVVATKNGRKYAYVVSLVYLTKQYALEIVDVSDPGNPVHHGKVSYGSFTESDDIDDILSGSIRIVGDYAYVLSYTSDSLHIIDVSDPGKPILKGFLKDSENIKYPMHLVVVDNYAYVSFTRYSENLSECVAIVDVRNPEKPKYVGALEIISRGDKGSITGMAVMGNSLCVSTNSKLVVYDRAQPTRPQYVGSFDFTSYINGLSVLDSNAYVISLNPGIGALSVLDLSNPMSI